MRLGLGYETQFDSAVHSGLLRRDPLLDKNVYTVFEQSKTVVDENKHLVGYPVVTYYNSAQGKLLGGVDVFFCDFDRNPVTMSVGDNSPASRGEFGAMWVFGGDTATLLRLFRQKYGEEARYKFSYGPITSMTRQGDLKLIGVNMTHHIFEQGSLEVEVIVGVPDSTITVGGFRDPCIMSAHYQYIESLRKQYERESDGHKPEI